MYNYTIQLHDSKYNFTVDDSLTWGLRYSEKKKKELLAYQRDLTRDFLEMGYVPEESYTCYMTEKKLGFYDIPSIEFLQLCEVHLGREALFEGLKGSDWEFCFDGDMLVALIALRGEDYKKRFIQIIIASDNYNELEHNLLLLKNELVKKNKVHLFIDG